MWKFNQSAVQGRGHLSSNIPCQDKVYSKEENGVVVSVLADGASSAKMSHFGAECVTHLMADYLCENFDGIYGSDNVSDVKKKILELIHNKLNELSNELQCDFKDLASTLLIVAIKEEDVFILHLGDGLIGYRKNGDIKVVSHPDNLEFCNFTVFTTSKNAYEHLRLFKDKLNGADGFILMSDGAENSLYSIKEKKLVKAVEKILDNPKCDLTELISNHMITKTTDDCSICTLTHVEDIVSQPVVDTKPVDSKKKSYILGVLIVFIILIILYLVIK